RFQKIYSWYDKPENLTFTHGHGTLTSKDPPGSHCTHIGKTHRQKMHEALAKWFEIKLPGGEESTDRHDSSQLKCWTDELRAKLKPVSLLVSIRALQNPSGPVEGAAAFKKADWKYDWQSDEMDLPDVKARQYVLKSVGNRLIPFLIFEPSS